MKPLYLSFYTPTYAGEAKALIETLGAFKLPHHVEAIAPFGDWLQHIQYKAKFLLRKLQEYPGRPLVWLDADARVRQYPLMFDLLDCDFAAHWRAGVELLSSTMYFAPTLESYELLKHWHDACIGSPRWDQVELQRVISLQSPFPDGLSVQRNGLRVCNLPPSYAAIFDFNMCPESEWVISQHQASRRLKNVR